MNKPKKHPAYIKLQEKLGHRPQKVISSSVKINKPINCICRRDNGIMAKEFIYFGKLHKDIHIPAPDRAYALKTIPSHARHGSHDYISSKN